jgi:DNA-binding Lrp family transcriptional regulator
LSARGDAWISAYTTSHQAGGALVDVDCEANTAHSVALALSSDARAVTVEETSGARDLLVSVITGSIVELSDFLRQIQQISGVRSVRSHVITGIVKDAGQWRLNALEPDKALDLQAASPSPAGGFRDLDTVGRRLIAALSLDGRMPVTELADRLSVSVNTVRRRMVQIESSGWLRLRCDTTRAVSGHTFAVTLRLAVPPTMLREEARSIGEIPEVRAVFCVTGPQNLAVVVWLRHSEDLPEFEARPARHAPPAMISDRVVTLRTVKHVGRILDDQGRATAVVPLDSGSL